MKIINRDRSVPKAAAENTAELAAEAAKITEDPEIPEFSRAQLATFNSEYVNSMDEVHAILDETNRLSRNHLKKEK